MKKSLLVSLGLALCLVTGGRADTVTFKNGAVLTGQYQGGTATVVKIQTADGVQSIDVSQLKGLTFTPPPAPPPPPPAPVPTTLPAAVTLPAGTVLLVQMQDSVSSRSAPGANFTTRLQYNLTANGVVAVKAGTIIYGKVQSATQAGRSFGRSTLDIRLAQMIVNGSPVPIATSSYAQAGASEGKKTVMAAGAGAVIGNNTGGTSGGGAAWGAGAAALKPGQTLTVPPGALVEFTLTQPVTVSVAN